MSSVTNNSVIEFNSDVVQHLRSLYGLETQERLDEAINILIEWIKKQDYFIQKDTSEYFIHTMNILYTLYQNIIELRISFFEVKKKAMFRFFEFFYYKYIFYFI